MNGSGNKRVENGTSAHRPVIAIRQQQSFDTHLSFAFTTAKSNIGIVMPKLSPKEFRDRVIGRPAKSTFVSSCYVHFCPDEEECFYLNGDPRLPFGRVPFSLVEAMESLDDETVRIHFRPNDIVAAQLALAVGVSLSEPTVDATLSPPSTLLSEEKAENELTTTLQFIGEYRDGTSTSDYHQFLIEDTD